MDYLEFASGAAIPNGTGILFLASRDDGDAYREEFSRSGVAEFLGDVLRRVRLVAQIEAAANIARLQLPVLARQPTRVGEAPPETHALAARAALGLSASEPITSLCNLVRSHGVLLLWKSSDSPLVWLRGASLREPIATIVVAEPYRLDAQSATRSRFTLAHELGHLLFDHYRGKSPVMYSPGEGVRFRAFTDFDAIENEADAFAACFLAPAGAVRALIDGRDPTAESTIALVGRHFGVGREVALNRLSHSRSITTNQRLEIDQRDKYVFQRYTPDILGDIPKQEDVGINAGELRRCVVVGVERGMIGRAFAHDLLQVPYEESLGAPPGGSPIEPLWDSSRVALARADQIMADISSSLTAVSAVPRDGGHWCVRLTLHAGDPQERDEWIELDERFSPVTASRPDLVPPAQSA